MVIKKVNLDIVIGVTSQVPETALPEVAFAGKSNVGKSSLINALMNRKSYARTSSQPGKTQTINYYNINDEMLLVDLPGYGCAKISKQELKRFGELMEGYFKSGRNIALVVLLIDMRHPLTKDDEGMICFLKEMDIPFIIVMTKADKLKKTAYKERLDLSGKELAFAGKVPVVPFSSVTGQGINGIKNYIEKSVM